MCRLATMFLLTLPLAAAEPAVSVSVPDELRNPWPDGWETEFQARREKVLKGMCAKEKVNGLGGRTYFENEKRAYGFLLAHAVAGEKEAAVKELQKEDAQAKEWHSVTEGIDYYACFTLKHQMRKYFLFKNQFDPKYAQRMFDGAKLWTEKDPLRRPHPAFKQAGEGWGPDVRNSWVDVRGTENLFLMRVTSVYLMAEETGNADTAKQYKETILKYAAALYRVGMGEWDSENYHGHSLGPLLNLFDFATDKQVRAAAKSCLDYMTAVAAVKYYRGAFNGPTNRDYNHPQPFGGSAPCMTWLWFGDCPLENTAYESDEVHVLTSGYRPPAAVVELARKNFPRPAEVFASKPNYGATTGNDLKSPPDYFETQFFGRTFQMGSLAGGTTTGTSAINGFKIVLNDDKRGAVAIQGVPGPDAKFVGSAKYAKDKVSGENRVGQNGNAAVWLVQGGESSWVWTFPDGVSVEQAKGVTFLKGEKTWVALTPINASVFKVDDERTKALTADPKDAMWKGHTVVSAKGKGGKFCGVAIEVGEAGEYKDFAAFQAAVAEKAKLTAESFDDGEAEYAGACGKSVKVKFAAKVSELGVWRDGKPHDWREHAKHLYHTAGDTPVIEQKWLGGTLTVRAGKKTFTGTVSDKGAATFKNE